MTATDLANLNAVNANIADSLNRINQTLDLLIALGIAAVALMLVGGWIATAWVWKETRRKS